MFYLSCFVSDPNSFPPFFQVVLPVVARKKGLDEHYESADGSPQPKKMANTVAPVRNDRSHSSFSYYDCRLSFIVTFSPLSLYRLHYIHVYVCFFTHFCAFFMCRHQVRLVTIILNIGDHQTIPSPYPWTSSVDHRTKMKTRSDNNCPMKYHPLCAKNLLGQNRSNRHHHDILHRICKLLHRLWIWCPNNHSHWRRRK